MQSLDQIDWPLQMAGVAGSGRYGEVKAPWDGQLLGRVEFADEVAVEQALATAKRLHADRDSWLPCSERIDILRRCAQIMRDNAEYLAMAAAQEGGKPLPDSQVEVARAIDSVEICIETLRGHAGDVVPMNVSSASAGRIAFTQGEPIGPVVAVSAFNHPLNLIAHQVAPAVAVGCPVIVKPARATPLSCLRFIAMLREAGLPEEWAVPLILDDRKLSESLVTDSRVGFFSFIGSAKVGWSLRGQLAPGARCALEHGGVAPVIVAQDANIAAAVPLLAKGGFYHAGQVCVSVQRVFAPTSIARDLAERLAAAGLAMPVGDPSLPDTQIGPLITHAEVDRVEQWVNEAVAAGAELISGGKRLSDSCYEPTVLLNPPAHVQVSTKEVFGPVICVYAEDDLDTAIALANSLDVSFQAAVFTRNMDTALRCYKRLNGSAIMVNDHTAFRVDWMPFAGMSTSGHGVGGVPHTMHEMQNHKMLVMRSSEI
ncbi:MAG: aldehyde dehydrogenase family protein [Oceanococcus sp.]